VLIIACMVTARSSAMTFTGLPTSTGRAQSRTAGGPSGALSPAAGLYVSLREFGPVRRLLRSFSVALRQPRSAAAFDAGAAVLCFYSYTKRFTRWSHFVLGSAIAFSRWRLAGDSPVVGGLPAVVLMGR